MQLKAKVGLNYKQNTIFNWFLFFPFELSFHFLIELRETQNKAVIQNSDVKVTCVSKKLPRSFSIDSAEAAKS